MSDYTKVNLKELDNMAEQFGMGDDLETRFARKPMGLEQFGFSYQKTADPVFHDFYYPAGSARPTYITATVRVPVAGERRSPNRTVAAFDDGFYMRNLDLVR